MVAIDGQGNVLIKGEDFYWLIEQAERVQELELEKDEWKYTAQCYYMTNKELREQRKRYREALNSIINLWLASTDATDDTWLAHEMSETARQALEGENNE